MSHKGEMSLLAELINDRSENENKKNKTTNKITLKEWTGKSNFPVDMSKTEVMEACIDLVTTEKMPFLVLDSKAFTTLTKQIFDGLNMSPVSSRNIMMLVERKYNEIKASLKLLFKNNIVCIKMDTATRCNRGIFGINAEIYHNNRICVKTLSLVELQRHKDIQEAIYARKSRKF